MTQKELKEWIKRINNKLDNHLHDTAIDITNIKNDIKWIKLIGWFIITTSVTSMIGVILGLIFK